ncbi:DsrE family protein [[Clostridium] innocuum]|nr:DsrE family protein [[Clostridium] innocuum]
MPARQFGIEPRVGILSYSTFGSGSGASCEQSGEAFHIEIVVNGRAVRQLRKEAAVQLEYSDIFCDFMKRGVVIAACRNAMKGQKVEEQELLDGVATVASGVVELALKQQEGYSYIKP